MAPRRRRDLFFCQDTPARACPSTAAMPRYTRRPRLGSTPRRPGPRQHCPPAPRRLARAVGAGRRPCLCGPAARGRNRCLPDPEPLLRPSQLASRLDELDALFVDLDYYKTEHADAHPQHVLGLTLEALQDKQLPPPSFAVASGRGLALVWLHHAVPRAALPRWRACQQVLWHTLRHLGADRLASDAARVLRLVGTRNSRSSTLVEGLTAPGEPWDFDQLADEILPLQRAELVALRLVRARKRAAAILCGNRRRDRKVRLPRRT